MADTPQARDEAGRLAAALERIARAQELRERDTIAARDLTGQTAGDRPAVDRPAVDRPAADNTNLARRLDVLISELRTLLGRDSGD